MNKFICIVACACAVVLLPTSLSARELLVKVVDAFTGVPIPEVTVTVDFWGEGTKFTFTRTSNEKGEFRLKKRMFTNVSFFVAETERNYCTANFYKKFEGKADVECAVPVALKGKPAKLRMKEVRLTFPPDSDEMHFDLMKGELLPPAGRGEVADVVLRRMPRIQLGLAYDNQGNTIGKRTRDALLVIFPGEGNGIRDMLMVPECHIWVRTAPESGYCSEYESFHEDDEKMHTRSSGRFQKAQCFRIRTQKDDGGSITNGFYGKIYGEFDWFPTRSTAPYFKEVRFTYYVNEVPLDRNLEKDTSIVKWYEFRP